MENYLCRLTSAGFGLYLIFQLISKVGEYYPECYATKSGTLSTIFVLALIYALGFVTGQEVAENKGN